MRRRRVDEADAALFSPLLDVLMNGLGAILLLLFVYAYFMRERNLPPLLILSEDEPAFRFASGSADLSPAFRDAFAAKVLPRIEELARVYDFDLIEIVGHTDGLPLGIRGSNLDQRLLGALPSSEIRGLTPGSNVDLGILRAISVIGLMQEEQRRGKLVWVRQFLPYSAGQCVLHGFRIASTENRTEEAGRRRIEIRLVNSASLLTEKVGQRPPPYRSTQ